MWQTPKKYKTQCLLKDNGTVISEHVFEAINRDEAEARAYLNCVIENNRNSNVEVNVKKFIF